jgi:hypothetical protein
MGEITTDAVEYAIVERLSAMLGSAKEDFKAVETYALFSSILCWVMQRSRTPAPHNAPFDMKAQSVKTKLEAMKAADAPWLVPTTRSVSALQLCKELRDAMAHGDARNVRPFNEHDYLKGFTFDLREAKDGPVKDTVRLLRTDMRRLGSALADLYCETMKAQPGKANIVDQAKQIIEAPE